MTRQLKKNKEQDFVEEAMKLMAAPWHIDSRENPDFMIVDGARKFGLEVTEIFTGTQSVAGAATKPT